MEQRVPQFRGDYLAARVITESTTTNAGLIVPVNVRKGNTLHANVVYKGDGCLSDINVGDEIVFDKNFATEIILGDTTKETYQVLKEGSVICVLR